MLTGFRDFATAGYHCSLPRGGIIGAAFGAIGFSLIDDVVVPLVGLLREWIDSSKLFAVRDNPNSVPVSPAKAGDAVMPNIGLFINAVVNSTVSPLVCFSSSRALTA